MRLKQREVEALNARFGSQRHPPSMYIQVGADCCERDMIHGHHTHALLVHWLSVVALITRFLLISSFSCTTI